MPVYISIIKHAFTFMGNKYYTVEKAVDLAFINLGLYFIQSLLVPITVAIK